MKSKHMLLLKEKILLILILGLNINFMYAQEDDPTAGITPPSPTASELGKYGQIPIGMFTGSPSVNIPLYTYTSKDLSVPISMSYSSNGIKVDQMATWTGLGFSLNAGGVISRTVRDEPDEKSTFLFPSDEISNINDPWTVEFFNAAAGPDMDTESDLFSFNFNGYSGKFVMGENKEILIMPHQALEIKPYYASTYAFQITTPDGISYFFEEPEYTKSLQSEIAGSNFTCASSGQTGGNNFEITAWYLTKIEHPNGDEIYFSYESDTEYFYESGITQTVKKQIPPFPATGCGTNPPNCNDLTSTCYSDSHVRGKRLASISSKLSDHVVTFYSTSYSCDYPAKILDYFSVDVGSLNVEEVHFNYDIPSSNNRLFLDYIHFKDINKKYSFGYEDKAGLPARLAFEQDNWGFYNGSSGNYNYFVPQIDASSYPDFAGIGRDKTANSYYAKKGLLNKVTYPTGGYTSIEYEGNSYYESTTGSNVETGGLRVHKTIIFDPVSGQEQEMYYYYGQKETLSQSSGDQTFHDGFFITTSTERHDCDAGPNIPPGQFYECKFITLSSNSMVPLTNTGNSNIFYKYVTVSHGGPNFENGGEEHEFIVNRDYPGNHICCGPDDYTTPNWTNFGWNNGLEKQVETFKLDGAGNFVTLQESINTYKKDLNRYTEAHAYSVRKRYDPDVNTSPTYTCKASDENRTSTRYSCQNNTHNHTWAAAPTIHPVLFLILYPGMPYPESWVCINLLNGGPDMVLTTLNHPCNGLPAGTTVSVPYDISHLDIYEYKNISYWHYLEKTETIQYDQNGENAISSVQNYFYENPDHTQLTKQYTENSDGVRHITEMTYPQDFTEFPNSNDEAVIALNKMKDWNMMVPIETRTFVDQFPGGNSDPKLISATHSTFKTDGNNMLPEEIYAFETDAPVSNYTQTTINGTSEALELDSRFTLKGSFNEYDLYGNITEFQKYKGEADAFIYGKNHTRLWAKAVNAHSDEIAFTSFETNEYGNWTLVGGSQNLTDAKTGARSFSNPGFEKNISNDTYLISFWGKGSSGSITLNGSVVHTVSSSGSDWEYFTFEVDASNAGANPLIGLSSTGLIDELRLHPSDALMTTYCYDGASRISTISDTNGLSVYYTYDSFGRLIEVRDHNLNLLTDTEYFYYNQ